MTSGRAGETERVAAAVSDLVEQVFATVGRVHEAVLRSVEHSGLRAARWVLPEGVQQLLRAPGQLAVGLGLVVAPRAEEGLPLRLEWWQADPDGGEVRTLEPDLRPSSLGYYDYTTAPWFDVPRRTGRRYVFGPHVDVHGTGRYVLTLTEPVEAGCGFVGVAGADVPVRRFETSVLQRLGGAVAPFLLLNEEDRVVLSTSPGWLVGDLLAPGTFPGGPVAGIAGTPWRLVPVDERSRLDA
ncbi:cache domain-containing protein [Geodermatophilus sp. SYSU D00758]